MKWGFLTVLVLGLTLLFGAPFWDVLAPSEHMTLLTFNPDTQEYVILATGSETLWYQWQSWSYIGVFCLILSLILGSLYSLIRQFSDNSLIEAQQKLAQKAEEMEKLKHGYRRHVEMEIQRTHAQKSEQLNSRNLELNAIQHQATEQQMTQSKLEQRDRLREEKKLIAEYLAHCNWRLPDRTKITYPVLKTLAKKQKQP